MVTEFIENDGKKWRHASVSRRNQKEIPTYEDLLLLKDVCIGKHRTAYQVFPPDEQFVHGHKGVEVLHLWCCLDGDVTPDFRKETPFGTLEI